MTTAAVQCGVGKWRSGKGPKGRRQIRLRRLAAERLNKTLRTLPPLERRTP